MRGVHGAHLYHKSTDECRTVRKADM
jgi:hypothetical protein